MAKDCGHTVPCGCKDTPLTTPAPCGDGIDCPDATACSETFDAECVYYTGDPIMCDDEVVVDTNTPLDDAIAAMIAALCTGGEGTITQQLCCNCEENVIVDIGATYEEAMSNILEWACGEIGTLNTNKAERKFAQTANSATITDPATGTIVGTGVGNVTVLANTLNSGDTYRCYMTGYIGCTNTQELTLTMSLGSATAATSNIDLNIADGTWTLEYDITIRSVGVTGTAAISGGFSYRATGDQFWRGEGFIGITTIDTTTDNDFNVNASWNLDESGVNDIYSYMFNITKIY
tara:strand:- start:2140 stop:3012 length:873 start_codon:yes stop_codon:yes gene_type:complete